MAQYTLELRQIVKCKDIFNSINYELYNNDYKPIFEEKFIKKFYYREIGTETVTKFLVYLESTLDEIMPYYTQLYKTTTLKYDALLNYDLTETITREILSENTSSTSSEVIGENRMYDTPITRNSRYKDSPSMIGENNDKSKLSVNGNNNARETHTRNTKGNIGVMSAQDLIKKERDLIINIDKMIFDELEVLFMQVF